MKRSLLLAASVSVATFGWFLLGDSDGLGAAERPAGAVTARLSESANIIASVDGVEIKMADVEASVADRLASLEAEKQSLLDAALDAQIDQQLIDAEAAARGVAPATLIAQEVDAKLHLVSDEQLTAALAARPSSIEALASDLKVVSLQMRRQLRRAAFVAELRERAAVAVYGP